MKIAVQADSVRQAVLQQLFENIKEECKIKDVVFFNSYDDFIADISESDCNVLIIARSGAGGMEGVRAARILRPGLPLIWLSDDEGFGPESYRLGCAFFSSTEITEHTVKAALGNI